MSCDYTIVERWVPIYGVITSIKYVSLSKQGADTANVVEFGCHDMNASQVVIVARLYWKEFSSCRMKGHSHLVLNFGADDILQTALSESLSEVNWNQSNAWEPRY
ncbi:uncharacterized protein CLUP02_11711 [Colletotrichum lupini]|uniref:Uncharacterized protein n=1 Tax=Colletotrichum lupini TaxID=145971 RepID=A0A9Q8WK33_9PEZI|nr:uncharacterized protein CLUP02_11711 [Colletotrichum lupini]UQC86211.1 hypothetical protein CLUP02_11711 [Colletotrichum lupini]